MRYFISILLLIIILPFVKSQNNYTIRPLVGVQNIFCHYENKSYKKDFVSINKYGLVLSWGLVFQMDRNYNSFYTGIYHKEIGGSFSITVPKYLAINPSEILKLTERTSIFMYQIPIGIKHIIGNVNIFNTHRFLQFKLGSEISLILIRDIFSNGYLNPIIDKTLDHIEINSDLKINKQIGSSISISLSTDLYNRYKAKSNFSVVLYYEYGLTNMVLYDIDYKINESPFELNLLSRGSNVGLILQFPIRLNKKKLEE